MNWHEAAVAQGPEDIEGELVYCMLAEMKQKKIEEGGGRRKSQWTGPMSFFPCCVFSPKSTTAANFAPT